MPDTKKERILVAMSGGVDSSVAAALLHEQGYETIGVTLHLWDAAPGQAIGRCCAPEDRDDARKSCEHLGIPHYVLDERETFRELVIEPFLDAYRAGETPSPCTGCNRTVKLVHLAELADRFGAVAVATGHYARLEQDGTLSRGHDDAKDQSYFLYGVPKSVLRKMRFPLGEMTKDEVREHGRRLGLANANKPDSQELCFVPDGDIAGFVRRERGEGQSGIVKDTNGTELRNHDGVEAFTIGQRKGLGLGGGPSRYVLRIIDNDVIVGANAALLHTTFTIRDVQWMDEFPTSALRAEVRIRHRHRPASATVSPIKGALQVVFDEPQRAIAPGQAAVVYDGDIVLGGGTIDEVEHVEHADSIAP